MSVWGYVDDYVGLGVVEKNIHLILSLWPADWLSN